MANSKCFFSQKVSHLTAKIISACGEGFAWPTGSLSALVHARCARTTREARARVARSTNCKSD